MTILGIMFGGGITLLAGPDNPRKGGFKPCPTPPCLRPCVLGVEPEVQCKTENGIEKTTFACCCCGSAGNFFKDLRGKN